MNSVIVPSNVCTIISHQRGRDCDYDKHDISMISCDTDIRERITRKAVMIVGWYNRYFLSIFKVSNFRLLSPNPYFQSILFLQEISMKWSCIVKLVIRLFIHGLRHLWNDCLIRTTIFNYHTSNTLLGLRNNVEHHRCHRLYKWIHELFNINPQHCLLSNIYTKWVKA
jgi:hypothetical protein